MEAVVRSLNKDKVIKYALLRGKLLPRSEVIAAVDDTEVKVGAEELPEAVEKQADDKPTAQPRQPSKSGAKSKAKPAPKTTAKKPVEDDDFKVDSK